MAHSRNHANKGQAHSRNHANKGQVSLDDSMMEATINGDTGRVKSLLDAGADINAQNLNGDTALMLAVSRSHADTVKLLLSYNCDVNLTNVLRGYVDENGTALHIAARLGNEDITQLLLESGADVNIKDKRGDTVSMVSASRGHIDVLKNLIKTGCDVNAKNALGCTALHLSAEKGWTETSRLLVNSGADINAEDINRTTPLTEAAAMGNFKTLTFLIDVGANISNGIGSPNALYIATYYQEIDCVNALIQAGASPDATTTDNDSPISVAVGYSSIDLVRSLIRAGADVKVKGRCFIGRKKSASLLNIALFTRQLKIADMLYLAGAGGSVEMSEIRNCQVTQNFLEEQNYSDVADWVSTRFSTPLTLLQLCRLTVNTRVKSSSQSFPATMDLLPLPDFLKQYLLFSDM